MSRRNILIDQPALWVFTMASMFVFLLVSVRSIWMGNAESFYLVWNLFLAWIPLWIALYILRMHRRGTGGPWARYGMFGLWLIFFPNAPYIFTDIIHLRSLAGGHFWVELVLVVSCALTGQLVGFYSLFLLHGMIARSRGWKHGWGFIAMVAGLSGVGVCIGRFLRWNSWDLVANPAGLFRDLFYWAAHPAGWRVAVVLPALFACFIFFAYVLLFSLTRLKTIGPEAAEEGE